MSTNRSKWATLGVVIALLSTGCAKAPFSAQTPGASDAVPRLEIYTPDEQTRLAGALERLREMAPEDHHIVARFIRDYSALRDKTRASREILD